jgi:hypothetical protein
VAGVRAAKLQQSRICAGNVREAYVSLAAFLHHIIADFAVDNQLISAVKQGSSLFLSGHHTQPLTAD